MVEKKNYEFLFNLVERFCKTFNGDSASLYVVDIPGENLQLKAATGYDKILLDHNVGYRKNEGLTGWIWSSGNSLKANSLEQIRQNPHHVGKLDSINWGGSQASHFMGIPLKTPDGKVIGVLKVESAKANTPDYTERDVILAESFADLAALAITLKQEKDALGKFIYAFVLMPFEPKFDDIYKYGIKKPISELGITCERVDEIQYVGGVLDQVFKGIESARIVIADMTGKNANVFYEVGYCHALKKDVILCTQNVDDIPFDLRGFNHIVYNGKISILEKSLINIVLSLLKDERTL